MIDLAKYPDRRNLKRINNPSYPGWQFATELKGLEETKFFSDSKFGSTDKAYEAAIAYRDDFIKAATELGVMGAGVISGPREVPVDLTLSARNTSGIIGVSRSYRKREDRKSPDISWVSNYKENGIEKQKRFTVSKLGEKQALYDAISFRRDYIQKATLNIENEGKRRLVESHIDELNGLLEYVAELHDDSDVFFFLGTINNPLLGNTDKQNMLNVRIGQRRFRKNVLDYWKHKCAVTGASVFLTAGHIKPWAMSSNVERLDVFNGLALTPVYDKAFDTGYITFDNNGLIVISSKLNEDAENLGLTGREKIDGLTFLHQKYLSYHRSEVFKK